MTLAALVEKGADADLLRQMTREIVERVNSFPPRPLEDDWPYLWIAATYL